MQNESEIRPGIFNLRRHAVQGRLKIAFAARANHLVDDLAIFEEKQRGDGIDPILGSQLLLFVGVNFADLYFAIIFGGQFIEQRTNHFARAAPFGPKVHQDGLGRLQYFLLKIFLREVDNQGRRHKEIKILLS
jgi:hypothetical protein